MCLFLTDTRISKSLVLYPEAFSAQTWIQMGLMAVFNEEILQLLAMMVSQILSSPLPTALDQKKKTQNVEVGVIQLFYAIKP